MQPNKDHFIGRWWEEVHTSDNRTVSHFYKFSKSRRIKDIFFLNCWHRISPCKDSHKCYHPNNEVMNNSNNRFLFLRNNSDKINHIFCNIFLNPSPKHKKSQDTTRRTSPLPTMLNSLLKDTHLHHKIYTCLLLKKHMICRSCCIFCNVLHFHRNPLNIPGK